MSGSEFEEQTENESEINMKTRQVENERKKKTPTSVEEDFDMFSDGGDFKSQRPWWWLYVIPGSLGLPSSPSIQGLDSDASPTPELIKWEIFTFFCCSFCNWPEIIFCIMIYFFYEIFNNEISNTSHRPKKMHHKTFRRCRLLRPRVTLNVGGVRFQVKHS